MRPLIVFIGMLVAGAGWSQEGSFLMTFTEEKDSAKLDRGRRGSGNCSEWIPRIQGDYSPTRIEFDLYTPELYSGDVNVYLFPRKADIDMPGDLYCSVVRTSNWQASVGSRSGQVPESERVSGWHHVVLNFSNNQVNVSVGGRELLTNVGVCAAKGVSIFLQPADCRSDKAVLIRNVKVHGVYHTAAQQPKSTIVLTDDLNEKVKQRLSQNKKELAVVEDEIKKASQVKNRETAAAKEVRLKKLEELKSKADQLKKLIQKDTDFLKDWNQKIPD